MSTIVNTGWLKDNNGEKFAPKTLISQVVTSDGTMLESKISAMETTFNDVADNVVYIGDGEGLSSTLLNADSLGGHPASDYYTADQVDNKLADIDVSTQIQESLNGLKFVVLSQTEYDALEIKDANTIYYIYEEV